MFLPWMISKQFILLVSRIDCPVVGNKYDLLLATSLFSFRLASSTPGERQVGELTLSSVGISSVGAAAADPDQ